MIVCNPYHCENKTHNNNNNSCSYLSDTQIQIPLSVFVTMSKLLLHSNHQGENMVEW